MAVQRSSENYHDICLDWIDLESLAHKGRRRDMRNTINLGNVAVPAAVFYLDDLKDPHAKVYLPKAVDLSAPVPGDKRIVKVVYSEQFVVDTMNRYILERWSPEPVDGIRIIATGDLC